MIFRKSANVLVALVVLGCGGGGGDGGTGVGGGGGGGGGGGTTTCPSGSVCLRATIFEPSTLTVTKGGSVAFMNTSSVEHNVTFETNAPTEGNIGNHSSGSNSRTMNIVGATKFYCSIHGSPGAGMNGTITVQ